MVRLQVAALVHLKHQVAPWRQHRQCDGHAVQQVSDKKAQRVPVPVVPVFRCGAYANALTLPDAFRPSRLLSFFSFFAAESEGFALAGVADASDTCAA